MALIKCRNCGKEEEIKFGVIGHGLLDLTINFKCIKCGCPGTLYAIFNEGKKPNIKVTIEKPDYFG